jgi:hypothetical protein
MAAVRTLACSRENVGDVHPRVRYQMRVWSEFPRAVGPSFGPNALRKGHDDASLRSIAGQTRSDSGASGRPRYALKCSSKRRGGICRSDPPAMNIQALWIHWITELSDQIGGLDQFWFQPNGFYTLIDARRETGKLDRLCNSRCVH